MPFAPEDIAGAVGVWVADDIAISDGSAVSSWVDRIASHSLAQATGGQQPLYRTSGIGGQPAVDFDGTDDLLRYAAALSTASSGSVFVVMRADVLTGTPWCESNEADTQRYVLSSVLGTGKLDVEQRNADVDDIVRTNTTTVATGTDYLAEWQSLNTSYAFAVNSIVQSKTVAGGSDGGDWFADVTSLTGFVVGALRRTTESDFFNGKIAAVIVVDGAISSADRNDLYAWTQSKYGIPLSVSPAVGTLHSQMHAITPSTALAISVSTLHSQVHVVGASRLTANTLHAELHAVAVRPPLRASTLHMRVHARPIIAPLYAGQPFNYPGGFPAPFVRARQLELHVLGADGHDFGTLTTDTNRQLQHVINDVGSGSAQVLLDNPLFAELKRGRVLSAYMHGLPDPVFDFLIEPGTLTLASRDDDKGMGKVVGGRGTLAKFDTGVLFPRDMNGPPVEKTAVINFSHPAFVRSGWVAATEMADQGNSPSSLWKGLPQGWLVPSSAWIWSSDGTAADAPGPATRWFVFDFDILPGVYVWYSAGDNAYEVFLNGTKVVSAGDLIKTTGAFWKPQRTPIAIPDGPNIIGIKGQNYAATVPGANPAGMLGTLRRVDPDGVETTVMFSTSAAWLTFPDLSDGAYPGVNVGMALIWLIEQIQARGGLEHVTWDFTALIDSNGVTWPLVESLTMNVGDNPLSILLQFVKDARCDLRMRPGSPFELQAFIAGTMTPASTASFALPLEELAFTDPPSVVNAYLVQHQNGYFTVQDDASIAEHGRVEGYITVGNVDIDEALYRANAQLALTKEPAAAMITLATPPDVLAYRDYGVGSLVPTTQEDGTSVADERVTSITVGEDGDKLVTVPTLRNFVQEQDDRFEAWLQSMAPGFLSGQFRGAAPPDAPATSATAQASEAEIINRPGVVSISHSDRHVFKRTGAAKMFYLFLGGLVDTVNIDVDLYINDVYIVSTTLVANQRRSPLVAFDPPYRVIEHDDWWSIAVMSGATGTGLQAHLIIE